MFMFMKTSNLQLLVFTFGKITNQSLMAKKTQKKLSFFFFTHVLVLSLLCRMWIFSPPLLFKQQRVGCVLTHTGIVVTFRVKLLGVAESK